VRGTRTPFAEVPPRVEYALTDLGSTLLSLVLQLSDWAASHHNEIRRHREDYDSGARKPAASTPPGPGPVARQRRQVAP
jgi:DNA-binding HxlR family transcriptional regulator